MENIFEASVEFTTKAGISVSANLRKDGRVMYLWLEPAYPREEYESVGMEKDWDEMNSYCEKTQRKPWSFQSLQAVNRKLNEMNKYQDGAGFTMDCGKIRATHFS